MIGFFWQRLQTVHGVRWQLNNAVAEQVGMCFYLPGSKRWQVNASAPVKGGVVLCTHQGGTAAAARKALERDWCKRSIGLFGEDNVSFTEFGK